MAIWSSAGALVTASVLASAVAHASSLDRAAIQRVLRGADPAVGRCAGAHALPTGRYVVVLTVAPAGGVGAALTAAPPGVTAAGGACVEAAFAALTFPRIGGGDQAIRLTWPFVLW